MEEQIKEDIEIAVEKKTRGGARPGAGRKKIYDSKYDFTRLKCKRSISHLVKACIGMIYSLPKRYFDNTFAVNLDGKDSNIKGASGKLYIDADAILSDWNIQIGGEYDNRIFALAFIILRPDHIRISTFSHEGHVSLRWQSPDEVARLMMLYGNLMARRNRLKGTEKEELGKIPEWTYEIQQYIDEIQL